MSEEDSKPEAPEPQASVASIATIVPIHAATGANIKRGRGRPKKINPKPTADDLTYHAEMIQQRSAFIERDGLVQSSNKESLETLQRVKEEMAREAASLLFARMEEEKYGRDTSQMSSRRIAALRDIANIELEIKKLGVAMIDLKGERFQRIFKYWIECLRDAAQEVLPAESLELLFNRLETKLEGWDERAQDLVR